MRKNVRAAALGPRENRAKGGHWKQHRRVSFNLKGTTVFANIMLVGSLNV